jgi:predicted peptidase
LPYDHQYSKLGQKPKILSITPLYHEETDHAATAAPFYHKFWPLPELSARPAHRLLRRWRTSLAALALSARSGRKGGNLELLKKYGIPQRLEGVDDFPLITVSPQCPLDSDSEQQGATLLALLDAVLADYAVDPRRVYLTGLSMGGRGSWRLAVHHPERFAALVPICGRIPQLADFFDRLPALRTMPVWVFHGSQDLVVPIANSERIVADLQELGGNVRFTVYPDADHDAWTQAYATPELYTWLLQYSLP